MQYSRLLEVFNSFPRREIKEISKFVHSPYFNQNASVSQLFDYLKSCKFELNVPPEKEKAFQAAYPKETYQDSKLRKCMSLLMRVLEQYLACNRFFKNETRVKIELSEAYRHLNLSKHFNQTLRDLKEKQKEKVIQNAEYHQDNYRIQLEEYEFTVKNKRIGDLHLQDIA